MTLTGSGTDTDGTITSYAWTQVSGPTTATITTPSATTTTVTNLAQGTYSFWLTVTDNAGATHADAVLVIVNAAPSGGGSGGGGGDLGLNYIKSNLAYINPILPFMRFILLLIS